MIGGIPQLMIPYFGIGEACRRLETNDDGVPVWNPLQSLDQVRDGTLVGDDRVNPATSITITSGTLFLSGFYIYKGTLITRLNFFTASSGATSPTNSWVVILNSSRVKVAESANALTAALAAMTMYGYDLVTPYTVPQSGLYYFGFCYNGSALTLLGSSGATARAGAMSAANTPGIAATADTGITGGVPALNPAAALTNVNGKLLFTVK